MRKISGGLAVAALLAAFAAAPAQQARADGGATVVAVVGGYLLVDYIVGHKCHYRSWPLNMVHKISGRPCYHWEQKKRSKHYAKKKKY